MLALLLPAPPVQVTPADNATLSDGTRQITLEWKPVTGADAYVVEVDYLDTDNCMRTKWCGEIGKSTIIENIKDARYTFTFAGRIQARWRVWAVAGERESLKSPWRSFIWTESQGIAPNPSGVYKVGSGVTPPQIISKIEPEFTDECRRAKIDRALVLIAVIVQVDGTVKDPRVVRSVGYGLDEAAIEAVKKWRFKPGTKDGKPVPVYAQIEIDFHHL